MYRARCTQCGDTSTPRTTEYAPWSWQGAHRDLCPDRDGDPVRVVIEHTDDGEHWVEA